MVTVFYTCYMFKKCINTRIKSCCSVAKSCLTVCDHMECSTPSFPVFHYFPKFAQTRIHWVNDTIQPSQICHPLFLMPSILPSIRVSWTRLSRLPIHRILQARILECVAILFSRGHSQPRDRTQISCIAGRFFTVWATREALINMALGFGKFFSLLQTSLVAQMVKRLPTMRETWVRSLCREDPLENEMATLSSTLTWKTPLTEENGRLQSVWLQRVRHDWATSPSTLSPFSLLQKWVLEGLWVIWKGYVCISHSVMSKWSGGMLSEIRG